MIGLIYSLRDQTSLNIANWIIENYGFNEEKGGKLYYNGKMRLYGLDTELVNAEIVDKLGLETAYFLSRHRSEAGIPAFTTHSTGNWGKEARFGGRPSMLSVAAPVAMLSFLRSISKADAAKMERTYEGTHHGPLLSTPSLFVELGGDEESINNKELARLVADSAYESALEMVERKVEYSKIVIGIGGTHYPAKFSRLAVEKGYAFSHIMPRYAIMGEGFDNLDVLDQTLLKSSDKPEGAVIEWKSIGAGVRAKVIKKLDEMGLSYERV